MTIDYEQLRSLVKEAMFTGGGINEPSAPEDIPYRMPAAEPSKEEGNEEANMLYGVALVAREATEKLVEKLSNPVFDNAFQHAFRASACLRDALNSLEESGAIPADEDRVVAPPRIQQKYSTYASYEPALGYASDTGTIGTGLEEGEVMEHVARNAEVKEPKAE
jgi:hypothetical protein